MMSVIRNRKSVLGLAAVVLAGLAGVAAADPERPAPQASPAPASPSAPKIAYAKEREAFLTDDLRASFPRLGLNFEVVGPANPKVNCYTDALGMNRWVEPGPGTEDNPLAGVDRLFGEHGYQRLPDLDLSVQPGVEKIVEYVTIDLDGDVKETKACAHQDPDGTWSIKVGSMPKIRITDPWLLKGNDYGKPYAVYAR